MSPQSAGRPGPAAEASRRDRYGRRSRLDHRTRSTAQRTGTGTSGTAEAGTRGPGAAPDAGPRTEPAGPRRGWILLAGAGLAVMVALAAWFAFAPPKAPETPKTVSYDVVDASLTVAKMSIVPDETRDIGCAVQATSAQEAIVGYREITVPADPQASTTDPVHLEIDIRTTQLAASGHVDSCWYVG